MSELLYSNWNKYNLLLSFVCTWHLKILRNALRLDQYHHLQYTERTFLLLSTLLGHTQWKQLAIFPPLKYQKFPVWGVVSKTEKLSPQKKH